MKFKDVKNKLFIKQNLCIILQWECRTKSKILKSLSQIIIVYRNIVNLGQIIIIKYLLKITYILKLLKITNLT